MKPQAITCRDFWQKWAKFCMKHQKVSGTWYIRDVGRCKRRTCINVFYKPPSHLPNFPARNQSRPNPTLPFATIPTHRSICSSSESWQSGLSLASHWPFCLREKRKPPQKRREFLHARTHAPVACHTVSAEQLPHGKTCAWIDKNFSSI